MSSRGRWSRAQLKQFFLSEVFNGTQIAGCALHWRTQLNIQKCLNIQKTCILPSVNSLSWFNLYCLCVRVNIYVQRLVEDAENGNPEQPLLLNVFRLLLCGKLFLYFDTSSTQVKLWNDSHLLRGLLPSAPDCLQDVLPLIDWRHWNDVVYSLFTNLTISMFFLTSEIPIRDS